MNNFTQHSILKSIGLHLIPGILATVAYVLITPIIIHNGYPSILGFLITALVIILPIELGILMNAAKKQTGSFSIRKIIQYRQPLPKWQYFAIPLGLLLWGFLAQGLTPVLDNALLSRLFSWLPEWLFIFDLEQYANFSQETLLITFVFGLVLNGFAFPIVEELYFRGYLLPRIDRFGRWAPVISASLFSLYHFWTPWQFISRIVWMIPWIYTAWKKRNIYLVIITHCLANTLGWLLTWGMIFSQ